MLDFRHDLSNDDHKLMTQDSEKAFLRLQQVNWTACGKGTFRPEHEELFFAYMAVAHSICQRLDSKAGLYRHFNGLFDYVPQYYQERHALPIAFTDWIEQVLMREYQWRSNHYVAAAAHGFVMWYELTAAERFQLCGEADAANPYLKLIDFLETGGAFSCEHNMFDRIYPLPPE